MFSDCRLQPVTVFIVLFVNSLTEIHSEKSLFDELPLNGALVPSNSNYHQSTFHTNNERLVKVNHQIVENPSRNPFRRQDLTQPVSLFDELPNQGAFSPLGNKNRTPRDSVDFDVTRINPSNEFDVPFWDSRLLSPIVHSFSRPQNVSPPTGVAVLRGPPPPHISQHFRNSYSSPPPPPPRRGFSYFYNNYHHPSTSQFAHGHRDENREKNKTSHRESNQVSATSGGPTVIVYAHPKKDPSTGSSDSTSGYTSHSDSSASKNEIHYHYHINNEEVKGKPGPSYAPVPPPYGRPGYGRRPPPSPPKYGPPPPPPQVGPYPDSHHSNHDSKYSNSVNDDLLDKEEDDFNRRTFITPSRPNNKGYRLADSISLTRPPSTSYEVPPAPSSNYNAPSSKYGPPGGYHPDTSPEPSYGPPTSPPAPPLPPSSDPVGGDQYETTITLQTIPVTRQVTELVQVPNVVHKISSNRPSVSDQPILDESINTPSSSYGPPAPPPRQRPNIPQSSSLTRGPERPFDSHLAQILGVGPTQNPKDAVLQELLLGQARSPGGFDMNLSDLELLSMLQGSRNTGGGGGGFTSLLSPTRNLFGGLFGSSKSNNNILNPFSFQRDQGLLNSNSDGLGSLREAFREQRFQLALADLRKQLREQNRDNVRERSGYRSLFTRGALLLSALTLLPSLVNPMASAAGVGSAAASTIPNFMLPVTAAGRRKRSIIRQYQSQNHLSTTPFEKCLEGAMKDIKNNGSISYQKWLGCANNMTISETPITNFEKSSRQLAFKNSLSINNFMSLTNITFELQRYILPGELAKISQCIQRDLCENILEIEKLPSRTELLTAYSLFAGKFENNRWISQSLSAASNNQCDGFYCHETGK